MNIDPLTETLTVPRPQGGTLDAYLAKPAGAGPFPGVVVIHEIFGLNENIRDIARRFANEGYAALAVDLFSAGSRVACMTRIFHGILVRPLSNGVVGELRAALDVLRNRPEVQAKRVGAIGFCMGGSYALQLACVDKDLRAASVFYGQTRVRSTPWLDPVRLSVVTLKRISPPALPASWKSGSKRIRWLATSKSIRMCATPFSMKRVPPTTPKPPLTHGSAPWRSLTRIYKAPESAKQPASNNQIG